jgi:hypothetical protein
MYMMANMRGEEKIHPFKETSSLRVLEVLFLIETAACIIASTVPRVKV